jgi:hypothetical protein
MTGSCSLRTNHLDIVLELGDPLTMVTHRCGHSVQEVHQPTWWALERFSTVEDQRLDLSQVQRLLVSLGPVVVVERMRHDSSVGTKHQLVPVGCLTYRRPA